MSPVEQLEAEVAREEAELETELQRALAHWRELSARLNALKGQLAAAAHGGLDAKNMGARVQALELPQLDQGPVVQRSVVLRREAVAARRSAVQDVKKRLPEFTAALARLSYKISAEEGAVAHQVDLARAVAREVAQAARKLEAAGDDPLPIGRLKAPARTQPRVRTQLQVDYSVVEGQWQSGFTTNLSDGGIFIATAKLLDVGTQLKLHFRLPTGQRIEGTGVVRWVRHVDDQRTDTVPGLGVQFVSLTKEAQAAIDAFVRERDPILE
jgi:uncharacterized protein (TIGR02266 family)